MPFVPVDHDPFASDNNIPVASDNNSSPSSAKFVPVDYDPFSTKNDGWRDKPMTAGENVTEYVEKPLKSVAASLAGSSGMLALPFASVIDAVRGDHALADQVSSFIEQAADYKDQQAASDKVGKIGRFGRAVEEIAPWVVAPETMTPAMIADSEMQSGISGVRAGHDTNTATVEALKGGLETAALMKAPMAGDTLLGSIGRGVAANAGIGVGGQIAEKEILRAGGYDKESDSIDPFSPESLGHAAAMGVLFGGHQYFGQRSAAKTITDVVNTGLDTGEINHDQATQFVKDQPLRDSFKKPILDAISQRKIVDAQNVDDAIAAAQDVVNSSIVSKDSPFPDSNSPDFTGPDFKQSQVNIESVDGVPVDTPQVLLPAPEGVIYGDGFTARDVQTPNTILRPNSDSVRGVDPEGNYVAGVNQRPNVLLAKEYQNEKGAVLALKSKSATLATDDYEVFQNDAGKFQIRSKPVDQIPQDNNSAQIDPSMGEIPAYTPNPDLIPAEISPAILQMESDLKSGAVGRVTNNGLTGNEQEITGRFPSTNTDWFKQSTVAAYDKENGTDYAKSVNKLNVLSAINKVRDGKALNKSQAKAWDYMQVQARELMQTGPSLKLHQSATDMEQRGFDLVGQDIPVGELRPGDKVVLNDGEEYHHSGYDRQGNAVLDGKETKILSPFDMLPVDGIKRGNGVIQREDVKYDPAHVPIGMDNPDLALEHFEKAIPKEDQADMADVFSVIRKNGLHRTVSFPQQLFNLVGAMYEGRTGKKLAILGGNADNINKEATNELNTRRVSESGTGIEGNGGVRSTPGADQWVARPVDEAGAGPAGTEQAAVAPSPTEPVSTTAPATSAKITIEPQGEKSIIVKGDTAEIRAKLEAAGIKVKGLPNPKRGGLTFAKKHEAEIGKALELGEKVMSREQIAQRYAEIMKERAGHDGIPSDMHYRLADAILSKDAYALEHLSNGLNKGAKQAFTDATGVTLPKQQGATWKAIREWAGVSDSQDDVNKKNAAAWREEKRIISKHGDKNAAEAKAMVGRKFAEGLTVVKKVGKELWWVNPETNQGYNLSAKGMAKTQDFVKAYIEYLGAKSALENSVSKPAANETQADLSSKSETQKEPWQMTAKEWNSAVESTRPEVAQSRPTKNDKSTAVSNGIKGEVLRYGVAENAAERLRAAQRGEIDLTPEETDKLLERVNARVTHKDVIEKALAEGKPVPAEVLADYPDLAQKETPHVQTDKVNTPVVGAEKPAVTPADKGGNKASESGGLTEKEKALDAFRLAEAEKDLAKAEGVPESAIRTKERARLINIQDANAIVKAAKSKIGSEERAGSLWNDFTHGVDQLFEQQAKDRLEKATNAPLGLSTQDDMVGEKQEAVALPPGRFGREKLTITKRGRKWFEATRDGKNYPVKVEINETSDGWEIGQTYSVSANVETNSSKYGTNTTIYPLSDAQEQESRRQSAIPEIKKWLAFVEEKAPDYVYQNGVDKLKSLGISEHPELQDRLDAAVDSVRAAKKKAEAVKDEAKKAEASIPRIYLSVPYEDRAIAKLNGARFDGDRSQWYVTGSVPDGLKKYGPDGPGGSGVLPDEQFHLGGGQGYGWREMHPGETMRNPRDDGPKYVTIISASKKYFRHDGMSFGVGDEQGYVFSAIAREATEEESAQLREDEAASTEKKRAKTALQGISAEIKKDGERPDGLNVPDGTNYADTQNIYGGGEWFTIGDEYIWYVKNNGMDGDNWSSNNVRTGGAGGIGWRVPFNGNLAEEIKKESVIAYPDKTKGTDKGAPLYAKTTTPSGTTTDQVATELRTFLKRGYDKLTTSGKLRIVQSVDELRGDGALKSAASRVLPPGLYPESLGSVIKTTTLAKLKSHPDYEAAKRGGDIAAAQRLVRDTVTDRLLADIKAKIAQGEKVYFVPVVHKEGPHLNMIPIAYAQLLAERTGGEYWLDTTKESGAHNTGASQKARFSNEQMFAGKTPNDGQIVVVDDNFTSGDTFNALVDKLSGDGNTPVAAVALSASRYQNWLSAPEGKIQAMLDKAGISEVEFEHEFGYPTTYLTGSEVQAYILTGGKGLAGLKSLFPHKVGGRGGNQNGISQDSERRLDNSQEVKPLYSKDGSIAGTYDPRIRQITLVADNIKAGDAEYVMLHEGLHSLMREDAIFTKQHDAILDQFEKLKATDYRVQDAFRRVPSDTAPEMEREEALAYFIENKANHDTSLFKKTIANIRMFLMRMGVSMKNLTTDDLVALVTQGVRRMGDKATAKENLTVGESSPSLYSKEQIIEAAKTIYSKLEQATRLHFMGMKAQGVMNFLAKQGVKKTEMDAVGLPEFLAAKKPTDKVTQAELVDFVKANTVELKDVVLGDTKLEWKAIPDGGGGFRVYIGDEQVDSVYGVDTAEEAISQVKNSPNLQSLLDDYAINDETGTHFSTYQEPGSVEGSYREMFVTAPGAIKPPPLTEADISKAQEWFAIPKTTWEGLSKEERESYALEMQGENRAGWQDGHSQYQDLKNPIVRIRFNEVNADGKRILRIEEMQGPNPANQEKMPAYLKDNIYQLGVKRILAYAKENGFDGVALATKPGRSAGETQADRYSLEKQISKVEYSKEYENEWDKAATAVNKAVKDGLSDTDTNKLRDVRDSLKHLSGSKGKATGRYNVSAFDNGKNKIFAEENVAIGRVEEVIGKELAQKIEDSNRESGTLSGLDLRAGGEGLKKLYDTQLPAMLEAYGKGKMGTADVVLEKGGMRPHPDGMMVETGEERASMPYLPIGQNTPASYPLFSRSREDLLSEMKKYASSKPEAPKTDDEITRLKDRVINSASSSVAAKGLSAAYDGLKAFSYPASRTDDAAVAASVLLEQMGKNFHQTAEFKGKLNEVSKEYSDATTRAGKMLDLMQTSTGVLADKTFNAMPKEEGYDFISRIQNGKEQKTPELQAIADTISGMFDSTWKEANEVVPDSTAYRENYFTGMWEDADAVAKHFSDQKSLEGSKAHTKAKIFDTIDDGIKAGFVPKGTPLDMAFAKLADMQKFITTHRVLQQMTEDGTAVLVHAGEDAPPGYTLIPKPYGVATKQDGKSYHYAAKEDVAQVFTNYLSKSLYENKYVGPIYTGYMGVANALNQFQLGVLSAFHAGFTGGESVISHFALGVKALARGDMEAAAKFMLQSPSALWKNPMLGDKVLRAFHGQDVIGQEIPQIVKWLEMAGARDAVDNRLRTSSTDKMLKNWSNGEKLSAIARSPSAMVEQMARPILEWLVPRQKFGVFSEMAQEWNRVNPNASHEEMRLAMQYIWNRVDSRLGQVVYERLLAHNVAKNVVQALVRAPGWTGGTIVEVGGGLHDFAKVFQAIKNGEKPVMTDKMAYTISLLTVTGLVNGLMTLALTGQQPAGMDFLAFRTGKTDERGNPERFLLPTYAKDIYAYFNKPGTTLLNKTHPLISLMGDIAKNRDYYGTQIRDKQDNSFAQAADVGKYAAKAFVPFWMRGTQKAYSRGDSLPSMLGPLIGIMPATSEFTKTPAQKMMSDINNEKPHGTVTKADFDRRQLKYELELRMRNKDNSAWQEARNYAKIGKLTSKDLLSMQRAIKTQAAQQQFKRLGIQDELRVFSVATDAERRLFRPVLVQHRDKLNDLPPEQATELRGQLQEALRPR